MFSSFALADVPSNQKPMPEPRIKLRPYRPGDAEAFRLLNEAWIQKFFGLEEHDVEILGDPEGHVLLPGGHIFFATLYGAPIGCCGLIPLEPGVYEVAKMAVGEGIPSSATPNIPAGTNDSAAYGCFIVLAS